MRNSNHTAQLALAAAAASAALWAAKAAVAALTGGNSDSPMATVLFLLGMVAHASALILLMVSWLPSRGLASRVLASIAGVLLGGVLTFVVNLLIGAIQPADPHWVWGELNLWVIATVVLVAAVATVSRRSHMPSPQSLVTRLDRLPQDAT